MHRNAYPFYPSQPMLVSRGNGYISSEISPPHFSKSCLIDLY
ncbi:rCG62908, isoform CRA_a [Rattus norvegicus]|uniref:RCG62908, isoform CRA_a n=1 Tax=Rattus norvegicus TaxID=10116 RepID=A6J2M5_RAT|nr:rCG62908, isoform CRA_a [Rattus norvegicus]EDL76158.1 rCG62908, isoform CRA_a [Rattus norvegicus]